MNDYIEYNKQLYRPNAKGQYRVLIDKVINGSIVGTCIAIATIVMQDSTNKSDFIMNVRFADGYTMEEILPKDLSNVFDHFSYSNPINVKQLC